MFCIASIAALASPPPPPIPPLVPPRAPPPLVIVGSGATGSGAGGSSTLSNGTIGVRRSSRSGACCSSGGSAGVPGTSCTRVYFTSGVSRRRRCCASRSALSSPFDSGQSRSSSIGGVVHATVGCGPSAAGAKVGIDDSAHGLAVCAWRCCISIRRSFSTSAWYVLRNSSCGGGEGGCEPSGVWGHDGGKRGMWGEFGTFGVGVGDTEHDTKQSGKAHRLGHGAAAVLDLVLAHLDERIRRGERHFARTRRAAAERRAGGGGGPIDAVRAMPGEAGVDSTVVSEDDVDRAAAGGGVRDGTITLGSTDDEAAAAGAEDAAEAADAVLLRLFVGVRSTCWDGRRGFMWSGFRSDAFRGACALKAKSSELSSASIVGASAGLARFAVAASASPSPAFRFAAPAPSAGAALSGPFHFLRSSPAAPCTFSSSALRSLLIVLPIPDACIAFTVIGRCASSARSSSVVDAVAGVTARVHHSFTSLSAVLFVKLSSSAGSVVARSDATTSCCATSPWRRAPRAAVLVLSSPPRRRRSRRALLAPRTRR